MQNVSIDTTGSLIADIKALQHIEQKYIDEYLRMDLQPYLFICSHVSVLIQYACLSIVVSKWQNFRPLVNVSPCDLMV